MAWQMRDVLIDLVDGQVRATIGPEGFSFDPAILQAIARQTTSDPMMLAARIAVDCASAGVDVADFAAVKSFVEARQWPW